MNNTGADADPVWKVLAEAGCDLDRGEILDGPRNAGLGGGNLFQAVGLAVEELLAGLSGGRQIERTEDGTYRACR
jgi:hypothetical protein